jgi:VRR-NUC domain
MAEALCITLGIRFFRIPDKLLLFLAWHAPQWVRVFVARYFAGVPDLMLFRPLPGGKNEVRFLELKTEAGKVSQSQAKWHSGLNVLICRGWQETERAILDFKNQEEKKP